MKLKLKALAAALLVSSSSAFAAIGDGSTGNGGLFLEVFDGVQTYIRDLGITMNNFGTVNRPTGGFTTNVDGVNSTPISISLGSDANWTTFAANSTNLAGAQWGMFAVDTVGSANAADTIRLIYTTTQDDQARVAQAGILFTDAALLAGANSGVSAQLSTPVNGINALISGNSLLDTTPSDAAFSSFLQTQLTTNLPSLSPFTTIGTAANIIYATGATNSRTSVEGIAVKYGNGLQANLGIDGSFAVTNVAAVPEPGTWAMMMAGLLMVGGIARRRLS
jgi:hypothetical protein